MTQIHNTIYLDNREKRDIQILTDILYDDMEVERLDIGDALMRGEERGETAMYDYQLISWQEVSEEIYTAYKDRIG